MKTVSELLRDADPLGYEPPWSSSERRTARRAIVDAPHAVDPASRRAIVMASIGALALITIAIIGTHWARTAVDVVAAVRFEVRLAEETPTLGLREAAVPETGRRIYLHREVVVTNSDISNAEVVQGGIPSTFSVTVTFNTQGAAKMRRATERHVGRPLAILVDGAVVLVPVIRSPVSGSAVITGNYTKAEAERIAAGILGR
jgi:preprotein translocase subunit SecD